MAEWPLTTAPAWPVKRLGDLTSKIGSGATPRGGKEAYVAAGATFVRSQNVLDSRMQISGVARITDDAAHALRAVEVRRGDVLINITGDSVARCCLVDPAILPARVSQHVSIIRPIDALNPLFLQKFLVQDEYKAYLLQISTGGTRNALTKRQLADLPIALPPRALQDAIAVILGALDDKIAANDRMASLSNRLALTVAIGEIDSWSGEEVALIEHAEIVKGASYRSANLRPGDGWLVTLKCVGRNGDFQDSGLKPYAGDCKPGQVVEHGDIVVAQTDLTQRAEVIGRPVRVERGGVEGRLVASLDLVVVRPGPSLTREVLFALLSTRDFMTHALGYCNGTTVLHLGGKALPEFRFPQPDGESVRRITAMMGPLLGQADLVRAENRTLSALRDTLLPKLMSGELRVKDAEKIVEDAT